MKGSIRTIGLEEAEPSFTSFLEGGGELGSLMRAYDWVQTPLGPPANWPHSLKTAVRIMLTSRQPFWLGWGRELTYLYNDPYKSIIGGKHPHALGQPFHEVWHEIWDVIGPMADTVMTRDEGTYVEAQLLIMERHGYQEETYYTFSYSPIPGDDGKPGGLICANTDDTRRVIGERQLATLRELAERTANARSWQDACTLSVEALATNTHDLPFSLIYLSGAAENALTAAACSPGTGMLLNPALWPCTEVMETNEPRVVQLDTSFGELPKGAWPRAPFQAAVLPIPASGQTGRAGVLVVGLNPFRRFDESYRSFLDLVSRQVAAGITHAQAYEEERKRAEALARLDQAKTAFFSNVSHEFRTPLTLMLGPLEQALAQSDGLSDHNRERLQVAHRNSLRLLKLVNSLLDFSRIEAGRFQAAYEPSDLAGYTAELASIFRSAIEREGLRFTVDCPPLAEEVYIDREMWEKIVFNLLSNALKFTFDGEIGVKLQPAGDRVALAVRDTGTGIPAEELRYVFQRFHRVKGARGRTFEGTGIGLALVEELVKLHGGEIHVSSEIGRGSLFTVMIPLGNAHLPADRIGSSQAFTPAGRSSESYVQELVSRSADEMQLLPALETQQPQHGASARILLADDNADMRDYVQRLLQERYEVEAVADGATALAAARRQAPDLVLTDVMMPGLDGFGLLREMRADAQLKSVPVVMLSARAGEEARIEGVEAGADDYLIKPFSARELLARVSSRLELSRLNQQLRESDRRKDEFLATLSHELRNPLAPLRNALHLMRATGKLDISLIPLHAMMERQMNHLVRLVDDLLEVSRINRGALELRRERVEVAAIVRNAAETSEPLIHSAQHKLNVSVADEPLWVYGDPVRLAQILANLLNNAAKYTASGGRISVAVQRYENSVAISVSDNGAGIDPVSMPRLFEMFSRGIDGATFHEGGLGIGLALARQLAQMHGGTVEGYSEGSGKGSRFTLRLPLAQDMGFAGGGGSGGSGMNS